MYRVLLLLAGLFIGVLGAREKDIKVKVMLYAAMILTWGHIFLFEVI